MKSALSMFISIVAGAGLTLFTQPAPAAHSPPSSSVRQQLPDTAFETLDGQPWRVSQQRGSILLLEFWSVNCPPCRALEPRLKRLHKTWAGQTNLLMVGLSTDDNLKRVRRHVKQSGMNWPQIVYPKVGAVNALAGPLGLREIATPTLWVVDGEGKLAGSFHDLDAATALAARLLQAQQTGHASKTP